MRTNMQTSRYPGFDSLRFGAPMRLARLRAKAKGGDWRGVYRRKLSERYPEACPGWNAGPRGSRIPVLSTFKDSSLPVRALRFADECEGACIGHSGWFADAEGTGDRGTIRGIVASLSHGRFLAGYHWGDNGETVLCADRIFSGEDAMQDAARAADSLAEAYADECREDDARFRAMTDAEALCETKESDIRAAWDEYRAAWCGALADRRHMAAARKARDWVRDLIGDLRAFRKEYETARAAYERG